MRHTVRHETRGASHQKKCPLYLMEHETELVCGEWVWVVDGVTVGFVSEEPGDRAVGTESFVMYVHS